MRKLKGTTPKPLRRKRAFEELMGGIRYPERFEHPPSYSTDDGLVTLFGTEVQRIKDRLRYRFGNNFEVCRNSADAREYKVTCSGCKVSIFTRKPTTLKTFKCECYGGRGLRRFDRPTKQQSNSNQTSGGAVHESRLVKRLMLSSEQEQACFDVLKAKLDSCQTVEKSNVGKARILRVDDVITFPVLVNGKTRAVPTFAVLLPDGEFYFHHFLLLHKRTITAEYQERLWLSKNKNYKYIPPHFSDYYESDLLNEFEFKTLHAWAAKLLELHPLSKITVIREEDSASPRMEAELNIYTMFIRSISTYEHRMKLIPRLMLQERKEWQKLIKKKGAPRKMRPKKLDGTTSISKKK